VRVLRDDGRTLAQDDGRLPRRREEAAAPRREVAGGGADQGPGYPTGAITACRCASSAAFEVDLTKRLHDLLKMRANLIAPDCRFLERRYGTRPR